MGNVVAAHVRTAALVVIVFLILAMLSRMSAPEVQLDITVQHGLNKFINKSQELEQEANNATHPVHRLVYLTQALNYLDSALTLGSPKTCETVTKCKVNTLYSTLSQQQESSALQLKHMLAQQVQPQRPQQPHPPQPVPVPHQPLLPRL